MTDLLQLNPLGAFIVFSPSTRWRYVFKGTVIAYATPHSLRGWLIRAPKPIIPLYRPDRQGD